MSLRDYFLLSPASTSGRRARMLLAPGAGFELARRVQSGGAPIGEVFSFLSGLYFRGKLGYARRFARSSEAIRIITSERGLVSPDLPITREDREPESVYRTVMSTLASKFSHASSSLALLPWACDSVIL